MEKIERRNKWKDEMGKEMKKKWDRQREGEKLKIKEAIV